MFCKSCLVIVLSIIGLCACQRQPIGGFLPVRAAAVRTAPPVAPPIYRAVQGLGAAIDPGEVHLPGLERQLAAAEQARASGERSQAPGPVEPSQPKPETMTSLADQLGVYGRGASRQSLQQLPGFEPATTPGRVAHQPTAVDNALRKETATPNKKVDKAQRRKTTGSNLRPALVVLAVALILMVVGLKL